MALEDYSPNPWATVIIRVQVEGVQGYDMKIKWPWSFQIQLTLDH